MALTDRGIQALKPREKNYRVADSHGLVVEVTTTGYKSFRYRYRFAGRLKLVVLGAYPEMKLAEARIAAASARQMLDEGRDPAAAKRQAKEQVAIGAANTFRTIAEAWHQKSKVKLAPSTQSKHEGMFANWIYPAIGDLPVGQIKATHLVALLQKVERSGAMETAGRVFNLCGRVCRYAVAIGAAERNPAADVSLADLIHQPPVKHRAALLDEKAIGGALRSIWGYEGTKVVKAALQLGPYLFQRPGELRCGRWADVDLDKAEWRYTTAKTGTEFIIPLPEQAVAILRELHALTGDGPWMFPGLRRNGRPISDNALNAAIRNMGYDTKTDFTSHGWRATARTKLVEDLGFDESIVEAQLAHAVRDANGRAYNRTTFLPQRRAMMQRWADALDEARKAV